MNNLFKLLQEMSMCHVNTLNLKWKLPGTEAWSGFRAGLTLFEAKGSLWWWLCFALHIRYYFPLCNSCFFSATGHFCFLIFFSCLGHYWLLCVLPPDVSFNSHCKWTLSLYPSSDSWERIGWINYVNVLGNFTTIKKVEVETLIYWNQLNFLFSDITLVAWYWLS